MAQDVRKPKQGDLVSPIGQSGIYEVVRVNCHVRTADLCLRTGDRYFTDVPWTALRYEPKEKAASVGQTAAPDKLSK